MESPRRRHQMLLPASSAPAQRSLNTRGAIEAEDTKTRRQSRLRPYGGKPNGCEEAGVNDFVKKLYRLLQGGTFQNVVSWGPQGDYFVVKDVGEFTKSVLPNTYTHQNFASFVRQLNKYNFHKIKPPSLAAYSDQSCAFKHPDFRSDRPDALDTIKRKAIHRSSATSAAERSSSQPRTTSSTSDLIYLKSQIEALRNTQIDTNSRMRGLEQQHANILRDVAGYHREIAQQEKLMRSLLNSLVSTTRSSLNASSGAGASSGLSENNVSSLHGNAQLALSREQFLHRAAEIQHMRTELPTSLPALPLTPTQSHATTPSFDDDLVAAAATPETQTHIDEEITRYFTSNFFHSESSERESSASTASMPFHHWLHGGLHDDLQGKPAEDSVTDLRDAWHGHVTAPETSSGAFVASPSVSSQATHTPAWAAPPRVLLVEDDAVARELTSKFLKVFGCGVDAVADGISAVSKMNLEKYNMVLMDIVMPKLDGVTATSIIRRFDHTTPIISMTSNNKPSDIMSYFSSGMSDILSKPFSKQELLAMLEKHLSPPRGTGD